MKISEIQNRLGENLKQIRKSKKLTQFELAEKANVSEDTIKSLEQGRTWCSDKTLSQITEALEIDVVKLFMPIGESFKKNKENTAKLKSAIAADVRNYVNEILKEFD
ncbi:MAG: helix-turn-helix domain-containing protein [Treponema sp.]|nr:helix-turn-helix domain-containing protein [Treponema sp.]